MSASTYLELSLQFWFSLVYTRKPLHARYIFLLDLFVNKTTKLCKNTDNTGVQCIHRHLNSGACVVYMDFYRRLGEGKRILQCRFDETVFKINYNCSYLFYD